VKAIANTRFTATVIRCRPGMVCLAVAIILLGFPAASRAAVGHPFISAHGPDGTAATNFKQAAAVAVDQATHDVYFFDSDYGLPTKGTLYRFDSSGAPKDFTAGPGAGTNALSGFTSQYRKARLAVAPPGAAGGTAGDVYVATEGGLAVVGPDGALFGMLDDSGNPHPHPGAEFPTGVATDAAGDVYIAYSGNYSTERHLDRYVPSGNPISPGDFDSEITGFLPASSDAPCDVAVGREFLYTMDCTGYWARKYPIASLFPGGGGSADVSGVASELPVAGVVRSLGTDRSQGDVYVGTDEKVGSVQQMDEGDGFRSSIDIPVNFSAGGISGVAVDESSGKVFLASQEFGTIH
jgi:hypothetical protein